MTDERRRIETLIFNRNPRPEQKQKRRIEQSELDSFQDVVQNKLKAGMGDLFSGVGISPSGPFNNKKLKKLLDTDKLKDVKKRILKAKGASPGRIKAEFGEEMGDGGVVDLTTEMVIDE